MSLMEINDFTKKFYEEIHIYSMSLRVRDVV